MFNSVLNTPMNCTLDLKKIPLAKYTTACVAKSFFSKFKVFITVSPKSMKPVKLPVFDWNHISFYFHFGKLKSNKSMSTIVS